MCHRERGDPVVDVDDMLDGKGTGGEKAQLGAVEGNSGGVGKSLWVGFYF